MAYQRVIPRDLFNEAKLLKCLGQLALNLHNYEGRYPVTLDHENREEGFLIDQDGSTGDLFCSNLRLVLNGGRIVAVFSKYNCKGSFPLYFNGGDDGVLPVFTSDGTLATEFTYWLDQQGAK